MFMITHDQMNDLTFNIWRYGSITFAIFALAFGIVLHKVFWAIGAIIVFILILLGLMLFIIEVVLKGWFKERL